MSAFASIAVGCFVTETKQCVLVQHLSISAGNDAGHLSGILHARFGSQWLLSQRYIVLGSAYLAEIDREILDR